MPLPDSPRHVFERLLHTIAARAWGDLPALYAEDALVELPFHLPSPLRIEGREALRAHFADAANLPLEIEPHNVVIHDTRDPELIVGEFDYTGRLTTSGRTFSVANVIVMRVRDGQIMSSRDYHNHAALAAALSEPAPAAPAGPGARNA
jgi:ketosteroid isomerase-like protein